MPFYQGTSALLDLGDNNRGGFYMVTPTADTTYTATAGPTRFHVVMEIVASGTVSRTLTFGTGFKSAGTLSTGTVAGKVFLVEFVSDGAQWVECSRTAAM